MTALFSPAAEPLLVTLLVLAETSLMSLAATLDPLRAANRVAKTPCYRWAVVSIDGAEVVTSNRLRISVDGALDPSRRCDLLVVLAAFHVLEHADARLLHAVRTAARNAGAVLGVEAGSWVLGLTGVLDGRAATTHWEDLEEFRTRFPAVDVKADRWVADGRFFTTGGAAPALDFMLSLIRARQGATLALDVASLYVYDGLRTGSEAQPSVALGEIAWREPRVTAAIRAMERHIDAPVPVATIARRVGVSTRTLEGLFLRTVGRTPGAFFLQLRLKAARRLLVDTRLPIGEAALRTGFGSTAALSRAFRREFGVPPSAARRAPRAPS
ncbi:GlxA family transcriptional regulator [Mangrovibrevibacter kandeliae]|uniref:GlxA family transcriptional regulator n=1 Tax=Mangrovibrevibacter kandeliae TaxID=2968473 RepID=UPI0021177812|nr:GlxA family transcriptional regulator [Aurantimonas sp. CSK15Z-1]